ncbi:MAG: thioredoxin family protein [Cytophagales bacterium]|nr:thioredoxin family protein [Cytophagales bacterium]
MKLLFLSSLLVFTSFGFVAPVDDVVWVTDYEQAFIKARNENKHVLINFTGSDWCGWCKKLDREVFSQAEFKEYAEENLVLLKLDFPRRTHQPQDVKIKNSNYARKFSVAGFPTILIAQANQRVVLRTGYKSGGAEKYIKHIDRVIK